MSCVLLSDSACPDVDNVLQRMTIVGVILSFRQLAQGALVDVLEERIPFLLSSILDFRHHLPSGDPMVSYSFGSIIGSTSTSTSTSEVSFPKRHLVLSCTNCYSTRCPSLLPQNNISLSPLWSFPVTLQVWLWTCSPVILCGIGRDIGIPFKDFPKGDKLLPLNQPLPPHLVHITIVWHMPCGIQIVFSQTY